MKVTFTQEKVTKNTVRFTEVLNNELDMPKIGTIYVQKGTLKEIGYKDGDSIIIDITVG